MKKPDTVSSTELFSEIAIDSRNANSTVKSASSKFAGTTNPRHLRTIQALMTRNRKHEELDRIAGCSNGPELIAELRRRGLDAPCQRVPAIDRDGLPISYGIYGFTDGDRRKINAWLRKREAVRNR
ncbi:MAG: hypothetical protein ABIR84_01705 [Candidatus Nitrotoga sp.]